jgi:putative peptide zinc metalloprotease protein
MNIQYALFEKVDLPPTENGKYVAVVNGNYFYIGDVLYLILQKLKEKSGVEEIKSFLRAKKEIDVEDDVLESILEDAVTKLKLDKAPEEIKNTGRSQYIYLNKEIIKENLLQKLANPFTFLFKGYLFPVLFFATAFATIYHIVNVATFGDNAGKVLLSGGNLVLIYSVIGIILFLHELGHATACKRYDVAPKNISFGFYLIFPVFFTDVTKAWVLSKKNRIVINCGGIYFQLLINALLIGIYALTPNKSETATIILNAVILTNTSVVVYSLMPFMRYDGYWIYSDFFDLPNLMRRSFKYPFTLFDKNNDTEGDKINWPLLAYSLSNYVLLIVFFVIMTKFYQNSIVYFKDYIDSGDIGSLFSRENFKGIFRMVLFAGMTIVVIYRFIRAGRNFVNQI